MAPAQIPDGGIDDDESAATEVAEAPVDEEDHTKRCQAVVDGIWEEYDTDKNGVLDRVEMVPIAEKALKEIGWEGELTKEMCDAFFENVDSDGNGKVDKSEMVRFVASLLV